MLYNKDVLKGRRGEKQLNNKLQAFFENTSTHNYVLAVAKNGRVYAYFITLDLDGYGVIFNEKPTIAKNQVVIKYRSTSAKVEYLNAHASKMVDLMSIEELKASCRTKVNRKGKVYTENCGECFEWVIAQRFNGVQNTKSNLAHTNGGDLTIDGVQYQVKYEKGAITVGA